MNLNELLAKHNLKYGESQARFIQDFNAKANEDTNFPLEVLKAVGAKKPLGDNPVRNRLTALQLAIWTLDNSKPKNAVNKAIIHTDTLIKKNPWMDVETAPASNLTVSVKPKKTKVKGKKRALVLEILANHKDASDDELIKLVMEKLGTYKTNAKLHIQNARKSKGTEPVKALHRVTKRVKKLIKKGKQ